MAFAARSTPHLRVQHAPQHGGCPDFVSQSHQTSFQPMPRRVHSRNRDRQPPAARLLAEQRRQRIHRRLENAVRRDKLSGRVSPQVVGRRSATATVGIPSSAALTSAAWPHASSRGWCRRQSDGNRACARNAATSFLDGLSGMMNVDGGMNARPASVDDGADVRRGEVAGHARSRRPRTEARRSGRRRAVSRTSAIDFAARAVASARCSAQPTPNGGCVCFSSQCLRESIRPAEAVTSSAEINVRCTAWRSAERMRC
jgi:hypothetical protein